MSTNSSDKWLPGIPEFSFMHSSDDSGIKNSQSKLRWQASEQEEVEFTGEYTVDIDKHFWDPAEVLG